MKNIVKVLLLICGTGATLIANAQTSVSGPQSYSNSLHAMCSINSMYPSNIYNSSGFYQIRGEIQFDTKDNQPLKAYTYKASTFNPQSGKVLFILHGISRNADSYLKAFEAIAEKHGVLAIAPEFPVSLYPDSSDYTRGVYIGNSQVWRNSTNYLYSEIEHLFEAVKTTLNLSECGYYAFGHSAGAQFLHRLNTFLPNNRLISGVAANSGWYTLVSGLTSPTADNTFPYGLHSTPVSLSSLSNVFDRHLTILVGEEDTERNSSLNQSDEADKQGLNRLQRGAYYYADAASIAQVNGFNFNWEFDIVAHAEHDKDQMAASAAYYLFKNKNDSACVSTLTNSSSGLVINEIHADPESSQRGNANGDGTTHYLGDEFIELVNSSSQSICLDGWTISDSKKVRHSFPVGTELAPGKALVVFGGGVPTGLFGNSAVQIAQFSAALSLTNSGDIITFADASGTIAKQVSWGHCAQKTCKGEYISISIKRNQSVVRSPDITGTWQQHTNVSQQGTLFSPGTTINGQAF